MNTYTLVHTRADEIVERRQRTISGSAAPSSWSKQGSGWPNESRGEVIKGGGGDDSVGEIFLLLYYGGVFPFYHLYFV